MHHHLFIFQPGVWLGEGKLKFSFSHTTLHFYTKWEIESSNTNGTIHCLQHVELQGGGETVKNSFTLTKILEHAFVISIENELLGKVMGKGVIDAHHIAWEFHTPPEFDGFENYEKIDDENYRVYGEYLSGEHERTIIEGNLWKRKE